MFVVADTHTKNILIKCVSVLSSTATGRIPIKCQERANAVRSILQRAISDQGRPGSEVDIRYAPRSSTPQAKSFFERKRVTLAAEVVQVRVTESLNELFSTELFVELRIISWRILTESPILRLTLE